ncbi:MAG TPA: HlyD family efflux transporter periplasmic adaptor subunit, partial [Candidatus Hydrogenedentes bacterium]|nr:HlyD family efflux transporter periplasmic adaptor subunit [Candidatus Hydrogenedentota bacterium]
DVENKLVLIELDSKDLLDAQLSQELEYQNSLASLTDAIEQYEIQLKQNESDITASELEVYFARMDLEKYLGENLATELLETLKTESGNVEGDEASQNSGVVDFSQYAHPDKLGDGEARQKLRQLEDERALSAEEVGLAETKLEGTKRLFEREFVTKTQLDNDQMAYNRKVIARQSAETSYELFIKYEFPKEAQKLLSDYEESLRKLERTKKLAHSKIAQAEAKRNSAEARHALQTRKREDLLQQIEKCVIQAPRPGLVVYGTGEQSYRSETIEEGATVRERQVLLTIPDTSVMAVRVQVHESFVKKIKPGQSARIRVDAYPNEQLTGNVHRIAVLPDSQNRWLNPDLKVYSTTIHIDGEYEWLKPGMSAEAEIIVEVIPDALQIPVHAVFLENDETVCYAQSIFGVERRPVKTGEFNVSFIQIIEGLDAGESVLLRPPDTRRARQGADTGVDAPREEDSAPNAEAQSVEPKQRKNADGATPGRGGRPE